MDILNPFITDATIIAKLEETMHGEMEYTLMNDFLAKYGFQKDGYALRGFLAAVLNISVDEIVDIDIRNPIEPGDAVGDKECILDIKVILNGEKYINIEIQNAFEYYWPERSITYLCRNFNHLKQSEGYGKVKETIQLGILKKDAFKETDSRYTGKLYSEYRLLEVTEHTEYSSKFSIRVVSLGNLKNSKPQKEYDYNDIYYWAKLFDAATWEEFMEIAVNNRMMRSLAGTIRMLSEEEKVKMACQARLDYQRDIITKQEQLDQAREDYERDMQTKEDQLIQAREDYERDMQTKEDQLIQAREDYERDMLTKQEQLDQAEKKATEAKVSSVKALMKNMNLDLDKALDTLEIQGDERKLIVKQIRDSQ